MLLRTVCSISLLLLIMGFIIENNLKNLPHYKRSEFYLNISVANTHRMLIFKYAELIQNWNSRNGQPPSTNSMA